ncbi:MAG: SIMPL domain-containing protein [Arcobacteraceae bacterium]|nr:SIMPL domain-containing protein [Arcobacteraceae bacterium]
MIKKSILLTLCFILPVSLFSYELSFNKKFSRKVSSDILTSFINITVEDKNEDYINDKIEIFNEYIEENIDVIKKNGNFNLTPKYKYYNKKQEFVGYIGSLRYSIESKDATSINMFINGVIDIKNKFNTTKIKLNISNTTWNVSQKLHEDSLDNLRHEAITWVTFYAANLSKQCIVKRIDIDNKGNQNVIIRAISRAVSADYAEITPIQGEKQISINPNYTLECK